MSTGTLEAWMSWELAIPFWLEVRPTPQDETTSCHWGWESVRRHPGLSGEPVTVTLLTGHRVTLTAMTHCYTLRLAHQSSLIGEASIRRRWWSTGDQSIYSWAKNERRDGSALSGMSISHPLSPPPLHTAAFSTLIQWSFHTEKENDQFYLFPEIPFKTFFFQRLLNGVFFSSTAVSKAALKTSHNYQLSE